PIDGPTRRLCEADLFRRSPLRTDSLREAVADGTLNVRADRIHDCALREDTAGCAIAERPDACELAFVEGHDREGEACRWFGRGDTCSDGLRCGMRGESSCGGVCVA